MNEALIVVGLAWGDEGKGSVVDYLVRRHGARLVVRFNGGAQAAHRVVTPEGEEHVFAQFGSGLFEGAGTFLSRHVLVNPLNLLVEAEALVDEGVPYPFRGFAVDPDAVVITPYHVAANRLRERLRGLGRHGSCGQGIGEARRLALSGTALRVGDLCDRAKTDAVLAAIRLSLIQSIHDVYPLSSDRFAEYEALRRPVQDFAYDLRWLGDFARPWRAVADAHREETIVFEGAQGALLDESRGYAAPYLTWTNTTAENAWELLGEASWTGGVRRIGVTRTYLTRHGPGPFPTEDAEMTRDLPDPENGDDPWQGPFRVGRFDPTLFEHALSFCPVNEIALTCCDRHPEPNYDWPVPVTIKSYGDTAHDKRIPRTGHVLSTEGVI